MSKSAKTSNYQYSRAHELIFKNGVFFDPTSNTYQVKSISDPKKFHVITKKGKKLECDCLGFKYNAEKCSHIVAVRVFQRSQPKK